MEKLDKVFQSGQVLNAEELNQLVNKTNEIVDEVNQGGGGYTPPASGIPKSDLSSDVQQSLNNADSALQSHQSLADYPTKSEVYSKTQADGKFLTSHQDISHLATKQALSETDTKATNALNGISSAEASATASAQSAQSADMFASQANAHASTAREKAAQAEAKLTTIQEQIENMTTPEGEVITENVVAQVASNKAEIDRVKGVINGKDNSKSLAFTMTKNEGFLVSHPINLPSGEYKVDVNREWGGKLYLRYYFTDGTYAQSPALVNTININYNKDIIDIKTMTADTSVWGDITIYFTDTDITEGLKHEISVTTEEINSINANISALRSSVAETEGKTEEINRQINGEDKSTSVSFDVVEGVAEYNAKKIPFVMKAGSYKVEYNKIVDKNAVLQFIREDGTAIKSYGLFNTINLELPEDCVKISIWYQASMAISTGTLNVSFIDSDIRYGIKDDVKKVNDEVSSIKKQFDSINKSAEVTISLKGGTAELQGFTKTPCHLQIGEYYVDCDDLDKISATGLVQVYAFYTDGTSSKIGDLSKLKDDYWVVGTTNILQYIAVEKEIEAIGIYHQAASIPVDCDFTIMFVDADRTKSLEEKVNLILNDKPHGFKNNAEISQGEAVTTPLVHVVKNTMLNAEVDGTIQDICVGYGYRDISSKRGYNSQWLRILPNKVEMWVNVGSDGSADNGYEGTSNQKLREWEHGLNLDERTIVSISRNDKTTLTITTKKGDSFTLPSTETWTGVGQPFVENNGTSQLQASLSFMLGDLSKDIWVIGDSYCGLFNDARWPTQLIKKGYTSFLMNAVGGENAKEAYYDLLNLLSCGHNPKYILWAEGMNGEGDQSETSASWYQKLWLMRVLRVLKEHNITPVLCTIPSVPKIKHHALSEYIRSLGYRYVELAEAVGSTYDGTWTEGLISSDNIHPSEAGAKVLCERVLLDFPEISIL